MVQRVATVAFEGIEARAVDVQVQVAPGLPAFNIVGLPDKAVSEAKERVRAALVASGLALPARRITVNLAPADLPKEGSHYDLPIALGLMAAIGAVPQDAIDGYTVLGELGLDGGIAAVAGVLPAAIGANARGQGLICPAACGAEAAWASPEIEIVAARSLIQLANHFKGTQVLTRPHPRIRELDGTLRKAVVLEAGVTHAGDVSRLGDVVTIKDLRNGKESSYTLVNPDEMRSGQGKISIASPVGKAIYQRHEGEEVEVEAPSGTFRIRIEKISAAS